MTPLLEKKQEISAEIDQYLNFKCNWNLTKEDMDNYNRAKNEYVQMRTIYKALKRQAVARKQKTIEIPEIAHYKQESHKLYMKISAMHCENCKMYKKHKKSIEMGQRLLKESDRLNKEIEFQKDIYWQKFLAHRDILEQTGNLKDNYPTDLGQITMALRCENELFLSSVILSGLLDDLNVIELASVVCALISEESRKKDKALALDCSKKVRKVLNKIKDIRRKIYILERDNKIENPMYINPQYCYFVEYWIGANLDSENNNIETWQNMFCDTEISQGDVVRSFKRTIDVLRQIALLDNIPQNLKSNALDAIRYINIEPVNVD